MGDSTRLRDSAMALAKATKHAAALEIARKVAEPWFRCQALAGVARYAPDASVVALAKEAVRAVERSDDPYEFVGAMAWVLRALLERGRGDEARRQLAAAIGLAPKIANSTSRADALFLVVQAVWPEPELRARAARSLVAGAGIGQSKKAGAVLRQVALMLATAGDDASYVVAAIADEKYRRTAERRLLEREVAEPRPFF
ncbi:MAG TPA: hypothetical protein VGK67_04930 [Myxococcales bacterium]|jgi:hypothetical protein